MEGRLEDSLPVTRHASFAPVVDARTHTLILGSLPGAASLAAGRYYAHPRNQFWRLLGAVLEVELVPLAYSDRIEQIRCCGIGLWDVIADAEREGSLDAAIRAPAANDLTSLIGDLPDLKTIAFNGGTAAKIGRAQLGARAAAYAIVRLPSSSPAHPVPFARKLEAWQAIKSTSVTG
jgi:hypoxanthine-DNA glycosylase